MDSQTGDIIITIGGKAGQGVLSAGAFIEQIFYKKGFYTFMWNEYPSLIKGGHNAVMIRVSDIPVMAPHARTDILLALDEPTIEIHEEEMSSEGVIIYDAQAIKREVSVRPHQGQDFFAFGVPLTDISKNIDKSTRYVNTAGIGALQAILNLKIQTFEDLLTEKFQKKSQAIVDKNITAVREAVAFVDKEFDRPQHLPSMTIDHEVEPHTVMNGSEAIAFGAIQAGMSFTAAYPMTPASPIFDILMKHRHAYGYAAKQAEDEISAICMTVGAGYTGVRAMTMTSGGGFSLMVEAVGLAGMTETPLVVVEAMRGGPSTGLPTKTEQSDLRFVLHASQGEFPRVVLAPGDAEEAFYETQRAFNLAEKYQLPVLIISDKYLATSGMTFADTQWDKIGIDRGITIASPDELGDESYQRYLVTDDGVSPRALPGTPGMSYKVGSDEHNQEGIISEDPDNRIAQMNKRMSKEHSLLPELPKPQIYEGVSAEVTLICWGSTKHICREAAQLLRQEGITVNVLHFIYLYPFDEEVVRSLLDQVHYGVVVENNYAGQFEGILREQFLYQADNHIRKYDGRPLYPKEIVEVIRKQFI